MKSEYEKRQDAHRILPKLAELEVLLNSNDFCLPLKFDGQHFFVLFDSM